MDNIMNIIKDNKLIFALYFFIVLVSALLFDFDRIHETIIRLLCCALVFIVISKIPNENAKIAIHLLFATFFGAFCLIKIRKKLTNH